MLGITPSLEDYIEAIYETIEKKKVARSKDIKERLSVNGASVTSALKILSDKKLINYKPYEFITLTEEGKLIGKTISSKHAVLYNLLYNVLFCEHEEADSVACGLEHSLTGKVSSRLSEFVDFWKENSDISERFKEFCIKNEKKV